MGASRTARLHASLAGASQGASRALSQLRMISQLALASKLARPILAILMSLCEQSLFAAAVPFDLELFNRAHARCATRSGCPVEVFSPERFQSCVSLSFKVPQR